MNAPQNIIPSRLELAVKAKANDILMGLLISLDLLHTEAFDEHRHAAYDHARLIGYHYPDQPMPALLGDSYELADGWSDGKGQFDQEQAEERAEAKRIERAQHIEAILRGEATWESIGLPSPEQALETLLSGQIMSAGQHSIFFDDGVTWFTNPYGQDGALGNEPDLQMLREFLADMAAGKDYGHVPH